MVALPAVPKVIRLDFTQSFGSDANIRDRIFVQYTGALSAADLATFLATWSAAWNSQMSGAFPSTESLTSILGTDLSTASSPQAINSTAHAGTSASVFLSLGVAVVVKFKINRRYRGGHPRWYLVPVASGFTQNGNQLNASGISTYLSTWGAFIAQGLLAPPAAMGTVTHVNVSYFTGFTNKTFPSGRIRPVPVVRATPLVDQVQSYSINPKLGSQRRRNLQSP
jgi:hypothetical protein